MSARQSELAREQRYVTVLYERLDTLRERTQSRLDEVLAQGGGGTHQNRSERDSFAAMYAERLARLWAVENGLCFGRLDLTGADDIDDVPDTGDDDTAASDVRSLYVGRLGLSDDEQRRLLIDWRAPA
ncbi:MAG TPA: hypothetical protein VIR33_13510, partial [Thermopolyspora sp.]